MDCTYCRCVTRAEPARGRRLGPGPLVPERPSWCWGLASGRGPEGLPRWQFATSAHVARRRRIGAPRLAALTKCREAVSTKAVTTASTPALPLQASRGCAYLGGCSRRPGEKLEPSSARSMGAPVGARGDHRWPAVVDRPLFCILAGRWPPVSAAQIVPFQQRGGRRRCWLLRHGSDNAVRSHVVGDQAGGKHIGGSGRMA